MTQDPTATPARPNAIFLGIVQFVALMSLMTSLLNFSLYNFGPITFTPYYFVLDGKGRFNTMSEAFVLAVPKSVQSQSLASIELVVLVTLIVVALGLWIYAAVRPLYRRYLLEMSFALALIAVLGVLLVLSFALPFTGKPLSPLLPPLLAKVVLLWFSLRGRLLSWSTFLFVLITLALVVAVTPQAPYEAFVRTLGSLLVFFLTVLLLRLISLAIGANVFFLNELGPRAALRYLARTVVLWAPMAVLAAPYFIAEHAAEDYFNKGLRDTPPAKIVRGGRGADTLVKLNTDSPGDSRPIVEMTAARQLRLRFNEFSRSMRQQQQDLITQVKSGQATLQQDVSTEQVSATNTVAGTELNSLGRIGVYQSFSMAEATTKAFDSSFNKPLDLPVSNSDVPVVGKAIDIGVDIADQNIQKAYGSVTGEMKDYVAQQGAQMDQQKTLLTGVLTGIVVDVSNTAYGAINSAAATTSSAIDTTAVMTEQSIDATFDFAIRNVSCQLFNQSPDNKACPAASLDASKYAQLNIWYSFAYFHGLQTLTHLLFGLVCVKSFLYVFSRVAFNRDAGAFLTLGQLEGTPVLPEAEITRFPGRFILHPPGQATYYVSRRFQGRGRPPRFSIPQPTHAPIARLLHGATTMNKVEFKPGDGPVSYTARFGSEFVVWDLQPGEEIVFNFRSFVAMSENVKISTLISARLSALVLGEVIFSTATGPGQIVFLTEGRAEVTNRDGSGASLPPDRVVAMHRDARLNVESELGVVDVYVSDAYIQPTAHGQVIVDVDKLDGGGVGLIRFIKHFVWPG